MDRVLPTVTPPATVTDGFGQRTTGVDSETGDQVELLEFAPKIVEHTAFVTALAERVARFASVRHASYVHLRRLDRPAADRLQLVSELTPGWRLSEMLDESRAAEIPIDISVVIALLRQLLPAVALFARHNRDNAIGTLSPERLIVTPQARLVIAEHAFGPAMEKLELGRDRLWREFRVTTPPSEGLPRVNTRADANAIGIVALTLLLGRTLDVDEFPDGLEMLVDNAQEYRDGKASPISSSFKSWLKRALQFDAATAFGSPSEAQLAFESVLASDRSYVTTSKVLTTWVNQVGGAIDTKRRPETPPLESESDSRSEQEQPQQPSAAEPEPAPLRTADPEFVITRSNGEPANAIGEPELIAVPAPAPEPVEIAPVPEPVEEIEIPLDEQPSPIAAAPTPVVETEPEPQVAAAPEPEPEAEPQPEPEAQSQLQPELEAETQRELEAETQRELEVEPETVKQVARPAFTREQLEEDPIARALLTYQPKLNPPPPPVEEPEPELEPVSEPVTEEPETVIEPEPEPVADAVEEPAPAPEPEAEPESAQDPEPPRYEAPPPSYEPAAVLYKAPIQDSYKAPIQDANTNPVVEEPYDEHEDEPEPAAVYEAPAYEAPPPSTSPAPIAASAAAVAITDEEDAPKKSASSNPLVLGLAAVVVLLIAVVGWMLTRDSGGAGMRAGEGELVVQSRPEGAQVKIDGEVKGTTPLTLRLDSGAHVMEVQSGKSEPRVIPLMITAGVQTSQYVELQGVAKTGGVEIRSEPAGARITIDGRPRGTAPATITDLPPGDHTVVLESGGRKVSRTVRIEAGSTTQLVVPMRR
jgi:hypothetical protein